MKGLSIYKCWIDKMLAGEKPVEYRTWNTPYRGDVLFCSVEEGKEKATAYLVATLTCSCQVRGNAPEYYPQAEYGFVLTNIRTIEPFPVRGSQMFWKVRTEYEKQIKITGVVSVKEPDARIALCPVFQELREGWFEN